MTSVSRRNFLRGLAASPLVLSLPRGALAADPVVRYDASSPQGIAMLEILADATTRMKARGDDDPFSWLWQWYTHFVSGTTTKSAEIARIFGGVPSSRSSLANEMWNTCQSHAGQNYNHFLPWHRMFVFYFERIVRNVSGRPDFTLPYWNYTSSDPAKRGIVPAQFRMPDDPVFGPLYRPNRTSLANSGQPIHQNQPGDVMDISAAMAAPEYSNVGSMQGFCRAIDSGIHGRIHVLTGTSTNMGSVPYAGNDPLFWVHHANIDRLWASWNRNGHRNPSTADWSYNQFVFVNELGQRVARPLRNFFGVLGLGYTYDRFVTSSGTETASMAMTTESTLQAAAAGGATPERVARANTSAKLGAGPVSVELLPLAGTRETPVLGLDPAQPNKRAYLILKDLHTWAQPDVLYHVYLRPGGGTGRPSPASYVGNINFFDAEFHDHGGGAQGDALGENFYSFDVTELLRRIARGGGNAGGNAGRSLLVTFVPGGTPAAGAQPLVGTIELHRQ